MLEKAARLAGQTAARYFRTDQKVWDKDDGQGPVSEADLVVDKLLRETLLAARPGYGWLSEETTDDTARLAADRVFIVDPIDGTRAFVAGKDGFAHSLAVAEGGRVIAGVVYLPRKGLSYTAARGRGARLNGAPIRPSARSALNGARVLAAQPQLAAGLWPGGVPPVERHFCSSLAYRLCLVAEGRFDAMVTLRDAWEWDIAAGSLVGEEAGVMLSDREGGALAFNSPSAMTRGVIAATPGIHGGFLARLAVP